MKNFTSYNFKKIQRTLFAMLIIFTAFTSCKKTDTPDTTISNLRVVNTSPASSTYNVYLSGTLLNGAALPFGGGVSYSGRAAGAYTIKFTTASSTESLYNRDITLNQNSYSSFYLIDKPGKLDGILVADDLSVPATDKAYIRFINLSPDAPALDLAKTGGTTALITNKAYKAISNFITIDAGSISFDVKDNATGAIKTTLAGSNLTAGFHYDVICGGLQNPANDNERPLSIQVIKIQ